MEPITLCGALIVVFGLWLEFETTIQRILSCFLNSRIITAIISTPRYHEGQRAGCAKYITGINLQH